MTDPGGGPAFEAELDALYQAPLAEFVDRRDALAKRLKLAGAADQARSVKALRKPSVVAWAINRLHLESGGLAPLEAASETLRGALRQPRSAEERRAAIDARRRALESVIGAVVALIEETGTSAAPALLRRVERTLLAIAAGGGSDAPVPGRLDQELEPPGFEAALDFPAPSPPSAPPPKSPPASAPAKPKGLAKSGATSKGVEKPKSVATPKTKVAAPSKALPSSAERPYVPSRDRQREAAMAAAQRVVDDTEAELERATSKAEDARARVEDAEKTLEKARREVEAARRELVATRTRLSERRRDLDRLRRGSEKW